LYGNLVKFYDGVAGCKIVVLNTDMAKDLMNMHINFVHHTQRKRAKMRMFPLDSHEPLIVYHVLFKHNTANLGNRSMISAAFNMQHQGSESPRSCRKIFTMDRNNLQS
jgi:hypothetical protein